MNYKLTDETKEHYGITLYRIHDTRRNNIRIMNELVIIGLFILAYFAIRGQSNIANARKNLPRKCWHCYRGITEWRWHYRYRLCEKCHRKEYGSQY